jgi:hypothetical protein
VREAALLVHSLAEPDREWLLSHLGDPERATLRPFVAELADLGIPADRGLIEGIIGAPRSSVGPGEAAAPAPAAPVDPLWGADAERLARVLRDEPDWLAVDLLALREWPWRGEVLARLGPARRRRIEELSPRRGVAPGPIERAALDAALVEAVARRVAELGPIAPRRGEIWSRVSSLLAACLRLAP